MRQAHNAIDLTGKNFGRLVCISAIVYGLVWVVSKMLTYREPVEPDPHEYADGEASALKLRRPRYAAA